MDTMNWIEQAEHQVRQLHAEELQEAGLIPGDGLYYPTIYYPPVPMYGSSDEAAILSGLQYDESRPCSVYVHIPFCRSRCLYCHWVVSTDTPEREMDEYVAALGLEIALWKQKFRARTIAPKSVLIGGGTPTALSPKQLARLFEELHAGLDFGTCAQITCETEPGSILGASGSEKLRILKENGVRRISLGVQAFDDASLQYMGRQHSAADVSRALEQVRQAGFDSVAIDLIYGYPGCTPELWLNTLQTALSLGIDAFQLYRLRIVPHGDRVGTIKTTFENTPEIFPGVDEIYTMKMLGSLLARHGGLRETSCRLFSKGGEHTSRYLIDHTDNLYDVIGFGASSWSNVQGHFYLNTGESLPKYVAGVRSGTLPINRGKLRTPDDERRWAAAITLKHNGIPKQQFRELTGASVAEAFPRHLENLKKYDLVREDDEKVRLTSRGRFFGDEVVTQFYHPAYLPFPRHRYREGELNPFSYLDGV